MLVLSRKIGQRIVVPDCELTVKVIAIKGKSVRLGISAPNDIAVYREEVRHQKSEIRDQRSEVRSQKSEVLERRTLHE